MARPKANRAGAEPAGLADDPTRDGRLNLALAGDEAEGGWVARLDGYGDRFADALHRLAPDLQAASVPRIAARIGELDRALAALQAEHGGATPHGDRRWSDPSNRRRCLVDTLEAILGRRPPLTDGDLAALLGVVDLSWAWYFVFVPAPMVMAAVDHRAKAGPFEPGLVAAVAAAVGRLREFAADKASITDAAAALRAADQFVRAAGIVEAERIEPGEAWADAALADLAALGGPARLAWSALLSSCQVAGAGKPTPRWLGQVGTLVEAVGRAEFRSKVVRWLPLVDRPRTAEGGGPTPTPFRWIMFTC